MFTPEDINEALSLLAEFHEQSTYFDDFRRTQLTLNESIANRLEKLEKGQKHTYERMSVLGDRLDRVTQHATKRPTS